MAKQPPKNSPPDWLRSSPWIIGRGNVTADASTQATVDPKELREFLRLRGPADTIGALVPGSRGRTKWKWINKKSPYLPRIALMWDRKDRQPELYYRLVTLPEIRGKGGDKIANKADLDLKRVLRLAEILEHQEMLFKREIASAIYREWHKHYPNTKRPTPRSIRRHLTGK
jgi:hypothetical protein